MTRVVKTWIVLLMFVLIAPQTFGEDKPPTYPMNVMQDEGTFTYYVNEEYVGESRSKWNQDGSLLGLFYAHRKKTKKFICKRGCAQSHFSVYNSEVLKQKPQEVF